MLSNGVRVAAGLAVLVVVLSWAGPAAAETELEVTTPADGRFQPGRPTPLLVTITADQAVSGTIRVRFDGYTAASSQIEVPGGSTKQEVVIATTPPWMGAVTVTFEADEGGQSAAGRLDLRPNDGDELVAVLPGLASGELPATADLDVEVGQARLYPFDPALLAEGPDVLSPFSYVAVTADDLDGLDSNGRATLEAWVGGSGGILVVDEPVATPLPLSLDVSGGETRTPVGAGEIRYTDGELGLGRYDGALSPTISRRADDFPWGGFGGAPVGISLAQDAGVAIPGIGSLVIVLLVYATVAGPLLWLVLRRGRREPLLWLALPAVAVVTTAGVYAVGLSLRNNATAAHATVVADLPGVRSVSTQVLVNSPNGGRAGIGLDDGWRPLRVFDESLFFEGPFGSQGESPDPVLVDGDLLADLPPGGIEILGAESTVVTTDDGSWAVALEPSDSGLAGTITNLTPHRLEEVFVTAGQGFDSVDEVGPGESVEIELANPNVPPLGNDRFMESLWRQDPWSPAQSDSAVNVGSLMAWLGQHPEFRAPGTLLVGGWTRDVEGPLATDRGQPVANGRTLFVSVQPLREAGGGEPYRLEFLRGWNSTRVTDPPANQCADLAATVRLVVEEPEALGADPVLDLSLRGVAALDLWTGSGWTATGLAQAPDDRVIMGVPAGALAGDELYLRMQLSCDAWGFANPFPDLRARTDDDVVLAVGALGEDPTGSPTDG